MFKLSDVIKRELIFLFCEATDKAGVIEKVADLFSENGFGQKSELMDRFNEREKISSTGVGQKIAIPHIFLDNVPDHSLLIMTLKTPVNFRSHDGSPVSLILALISNRNQTSTHLRLLARLARLFTKKRLFSEIVASGSQEEILNLLEDL